MDKGTSDERLLKIIEGGGEPKRKQGFGISPKKSLSELLPPGKFSLNLKKIKEFKFNLLSINKGLIGLSAAVTLFFLYGLFSWPNVALSDAAYFTPADAAAVAKVISAGENQGSSARKNILSQDIKRNVFLAPGVATSIVASENGPNPSELAQDLRLVGIIWSANPEVMIEAGKDPNNSRTYVLKKGDSFEKGQFKVKEVSRNSATLEISAGGNTSDYELR